MTTLLGLEDWTPDILVNAWKNHHPPRPPPLNNRHLIPTHPFVTNLADSVRWTHLTLGNTVWNTSALTVIFMRQSICLRHANMHPINPNVLGRWRRSPGPLLPLIGITLYRKTLTPTTDYQNSPSFLSSPNMPLCESPQPIIFSDKYYLPGGDLYILVNNTMFCVHRYLITCNSTMINAMLNITGDDIGKQPTGSTWTDPLFLKSESTTSHTFDLLLSIIYNLKYNIYKGYTRRDWFNILYVVIYWGFGEIERLAMQQIEFIDNHLNTQQSSVQVTRTLPSPTNTEPMPDSGDKGADMYVEESQWASKLVTG